MSGSGSGSGIGRRQLEPDNDAPTERPWDEAAEELGEQNPARADAALAEGHAATARDWYLFASACFRVGQVPLTDTEPREREPYHKLIAAFGAAGVLAEPITEHLDVDTPAGVVPGRLLRPAEGRKPSTVVIVGAGGEHERGIRGLLRHRRNRSSRRDPGPYPRFTAKVGPLLGIDDPEQARVAMERYRLTRSAWPAYGPPCWSRTGGPTGCS